jgi:alpha-L-fucosidase
MKRFLCLAVSLLGLAFPATAQVETTPATIDHWRELRFGMFIHWGPVALTGQEIGWSRGRQTPASEYDELYRRFDPHLFDADAWAATAEAAGMKYLVITAKHHDGFCLWPSEYTDYHIGNTPFGRDVLAELSEACRRRGVEFSVYYSIADWRHPDYPLDSPGGGTEKAVHDMPRYVQFLHHQTRELIERYGPLGTIWFDGEWESPWTREYGNALYADLKELQPTLCINNRVSKGRQGMSGTTRQSELNAGDYDTPEQKIGAFERNRPWETCMTLCRQWAWKPADNMKPLSECLRTLLMTIGGDGNLLFNVGPMPDGRIEPRQVERLQEMGAWIKRREEGIYGTRGGPFQPGRWGASTGKGVRVYLFVMEWPIEGPLQLPALDAELRSFRVLGGGKAVVVNEPGFLRVEVAPEHRDPIATAIELVLDRPAFGIEPQLVPAMRSGSLACEGVASASNVFQGKAEYRADKAFDDDPDTRWATDHGTSEAWLEVDLGRPRTVGRAVVQENEKFRRVRAFELRCREGEAWRTLHRGTTLGPDWSAEFEPVCAQRFQLRILEATEGPTLSEFQLFPPSGGH